MKRKKLTSDIDIVNAGIKALHEVLGPVNAHAFMGIMLRRKTDYVKVSRKLYKGQTVSDIFARVNAAAK